MTISKAYSIITIKAIDEDKRIIEGMASTPTPDRTNDIVEPMGAMFSLPMPLLWQHNTSKPIGHVVSAEPTEKGIPFTAQIAKIDEPGELKSMLDMAWQSIKAGLVRGVSIGFRILEYSRMENGGWRIMSWEWLELSAVTIPANVEATIQRIKSADQANSVAAGAASGTPVARLIPGVSGPTTKRKGATKMARKTLAEQISAYEATRAAKSARMTEIMDEAGEQGVTLDAAEQEEYDGLAAEVKAIDAHLARLASLERTNAASAAAVAGASQEDASRARGGAVQLVHVRQRQLPPGTGFTRLVMALAQAKGIRSEALDIARANSRWKEETPAVESVLSTAGMEMMLKAAVEAGTTTDSVWAAPLVQYQNLASEFIEFLRPLTIIGRIPGLRRVPFKVKIPRQTGGATVNWVGEGKVKPLSSIAFDSITLDFAKIAGIIPLTEELVRFSNPSAEALVRDELAAAIVQFMDLQFVDPTKAANDVSPASVTNGVTPVTATGTNAAALRADVKTLMADFLENNLQMSSAVWLMTQQQALAISLMQNSLGQPSFPGLTMQGGTFVGIPTIVSENIPATGGSPADGGLIILVNANDVLLADDGQVTIDASREASLQMSSTPDSPPTASTVMVSLWQHNMIAIKAERFINWLKRRSTAVGFIQNAKYAE